MLPARVARYQPAELDALTGSGELVWRGRESIGGNDGRIALYRADRYALLAPPVTPCAGELGAEGSRAFGASASRVTLAKHVAKSLWSRAKAAVL